MATNNPMGFPIPKNPVQFPQVQSKAQILPQAQPNKLVSNLVNTVAPNNNLSKTNLPITGVSTPPTPLGVKAATPNTNVKPAPQTIAPKFVQKTQAPVVPNSTQDGQTNQNIDVNYQMKPGESADAYNARVAAYNASKTPTQAPVATTTQASAPTPAPTGYTPNQGLYGQLITGLANAPQTNQDVQKARQDLEALQNEYAKQTSNLEGGGIDLSLATGQQGILNRLFAAKQGAAQTELANALKSQELQQGALGTAAGYAAPQAVSYSSQFVSPVTGQGVIPGGGTGSLQEAVANIIPKLQSGQMTYNDATQALSGYGQGGINALQQALPTGFNIAQSNTLAGQQGSITPALNYATLALNHAKDTLANLEVPGQTSNIPIISDISNWFSNLSGIGKEATRTKAGALAEARSAIQSVLASVRGGNPTEYTSQSYSMLPDNATPSDIDAAISNLSTLGAAKQQIYSTPGTSTSGQSTTGAGLYSF